MFFLFKFGKLGESVCVCMCCACTHAHAHLWGRECKYISKQHKCNKKECL